MFYFVRHGESTWNAQRRVQGQAPNIPLTPHGRRDAERAADQLFHLVDAAGPLRLVSSDLLRAVQTARELATRLGVEVELDPRLREQALGDMEGLFASDLAAQPVPPGSEISEISWAGAETIEQVWHRASQFLLALPTDESQVIVVSHETFIRAALAVLDGRSHRDLDWSTPIPFGSVVARKPPASI